MNRKANWILGIFLSFLFAFSACNQAGKGSENDNNTKNDSIVAEDSTDKRSRAAIDQVATLRSQLLGGVTPEEHAGFDSLFQETWVKEHYNVFNTAWQKLEANRLSKMRPWRDSELAKYQSGEYNLFYPFSGPDFVNAYEFFPNCPNYLMFGLEPSGKILPLEKITPQYLGGLRNALQEIFERNYFITSYMGGDLAGKGVLPVINVFLSRTNNKIVSLNRFYLEKDGKAVIVGLDTDLSDKNISGITIEFLNDNKTETQRLYYIGTNVVDQKMKDKQELVAFIKSFPNKITFVKSASYLLHDEEQFSTIQQLILSETSAVLQDDTGIRYKKYMEEGWNVQLYGKYARPVADFGSYTYQPELQKAFQTRDDIKDINFTYGYHWKTDNSSVLIATKPK